MGKNADGSWQGEGPEASLYLSAAENQAVEAMHKRGEDSRAQYDAMMRRVAAANGEHGMVLVGDTGEGPIAHSLKGLDSLRRKVATELPLMDGNLEAVLGNIKDLHRYTAAIEPANYTAAVTSAVGIMQGENAEFIKYKDTWDDPVYKGLNTVVNPAVAGETPTADDPVVQQMRNDPDLKELAAGLQAADPTDLPVSVSSVTLEASPYGTPCEFQCHTPGNLKVKDELHLVYELARSGLFQKKFGDNAKEYMQAADYVMASKYEGRTDVMPHDMQGLRELGARMGSQPVGRDPIQRPSEQVLNHVNRMVYVLNAMQQERPRRNSNASLYEKSAEVARESLRRQDSSPAVMTKPGTDYGRPPGSPGNTAAASTAGRRR